MKRTAIDHPKFRRLAQLLNVRMHVAIGVCELMYHFTSKHAIQGDIGKWPDEDIAVAVDWPAENAGKLIEALVEVRLLDKSERFRLVVHDWHDHADDSTKKTLVNRKLKFVTKLGRQNFSGKIRERSGKSQKVSDRLAMPSHAKPEPEPMPSHATAGDAAGSRPAGVFKELSEEDLRDPERLDAWYQRASSKKKPVIGRSDANRLRVHAAAERALEHATDGPPVGLFAWLVSEAKWDFITNAQDDRAQKRVAGLNRGTGPPANGIAAEFRKLAASSTKPP